MKRFLCLCQAFCVVALCLLTGCQSNDTKLYDQLTNQAASEQTSEQTSGQDVAASSQDKPLSGTLRVSTYYDEELVHAPKSLSSCIPKYRLRSRLPSRALRSERAGRTISSAPQWR